MNCIHSQQTVYQKYGAPAAMALTAISAMFTVVAIRENELLPGVFGVFTTCFSAATLAEEITEMFQNIYAHKEPSINPGFVS